MKTYWLEGREPHQSPSQLAFINFVNVNEAGSWYENETRALTHESLLLIPSQSENFGLIRKSSLGCMSGVALCIKRLYFVRQNWRKEICSVAWVLSSIKIHYSVNRIQEVYAFSIIYRYSDILLKKTPTKLNVYISSNGMLWTVCFAAVELIIVLTWFLWRQRHVM